MPFEQGEPFGHQLLFVRGRGFLFEKDRADRGFRNGWILLPEKVEGLHVEVFQSASIEFARGVSRRKNALAYKRATAPVCERAASCFAHEREQTLFGIEEDDAAQEVLGLWQEPDFNFNNHAERAFAPDE